MILVNLFLRILILTLESDQQMKRSVKNKKNVVTIGTCEGDHNENKVSQTCIMPSLPHYFRDSYYILYPIGIYIYFL